MKALLVVDRVNEFYTLRLLRNFHVYIQPTYSIFYVYIL